nr:hypothetical protein [Sinorhizobium medicae]
MGEQHQVLIAYRCLDPLEIGEIRVLQREVQRLEPIGTFGVPFGNAVLQEDRVFIEFRRHSPKLVRMLVKIHAA